ncbi:MAG: ester cyclase [Verrucomicrobia bacterium]|nr:ester cyclase [Verrucomicrobiota bacterium]
MSIEQNKAFVPSHFEEFVNQKKPEIADTNFAQTYCEHGSDAPADAPAGPSGPKNYLKAAFMRYPDLRVTIEDIVAEGDKVVVRNRWEGTDSSSETRVQFSGIVIWRLVEGKLAERWAYLQTPQPIH